MPQIGATGQFPRGKISPDDEGGIVIGISRRDGLIRLYFGKSLTWLGMTPDQAKQLACSLNGLAAAIEAAHTDDQTAEKEA